MSGSRAVFGCLLALLAGCAGEAAERNASVTGGGRIVNFEAPGNLKPTRTMACETISGVMNEYSPVDLIEGVFRCISDGDFYRAVRLYALAQAYGKFDTLRVTDKSAHQKILGLNYSLGSTLDAHQEDEFKDALKASLEPIDFAKTCKEIRLLGPPDYYPSYMIQHGIEAFLDRKNVPLQQSFDAKAAWDTTLRDYMKCPGRGPMWGLLPSLGF